MLVLPATTAAVLEASSPAVVVVVAVGSADELVAVQVAIVVVVRRLHGVVEAVGAVDYHAVLRPRLVGSLGPGRGGRVVGGAGWLGVDVEETSVGLSCCISINSPNSLQHRPRTHRLVVKRLNHPISTLLTLKDHLGNDDGLDLDQLAARDDTAHGRHGALDVCRCGARRKVLCHDSIRSSQTADGQASRWCRRLRNVHLGVGSPRYGIGEAGGAVIRIAGTRRDGATLCCCSGLGTGGVYPGGEGTTDCRLLLLLLLLLLLAAASQVGGRARAVQVVHPCAVDVAGRYGLGRSSAPCARLLHAYSARERASSWAVAGIAGGAGAAVVFAAKDLGGEGFVLLALASWMVVTRLVAES